MPSCSVQPLVLQLLTETHLHYHHSVEFLPNQQPNDADTDVFACSREYSVMLSKPSWPNTNKSTLLRVGHLSRPGLLSPIPYTGLCTGSVAHCAMGQDVG